ncbi:MAG: hypothetical protein Hals2KO_02570 [Halioglobus sp.]
MSDIHRLRSALKLLMDGRTLEERVQPGEPVCIDKATDPVLRELQTLGVPLSIYQQSMGDCLARVYRLPKVHHSTAQRVYASLNTKAETKQIP